MDDTARIRTIQGLQDMRVCLSRFRDDAREALLISENEINRTREFVRDRIRHWEREVRHREENVTQAKRALERCLGNHSGDEDASDRDCSRYEDELETERVRLRQAGDLLHETRKQLGRLEAQIDSYQKIATRFKTLPDSHVNRSSVFLEKCYVALDKFLAVGGLGYQGLAGISGGSVHSAQSEDKVIGTPEEDKSYWLYQSGRPTCAICAMAGVINKMTKLNITEETLAREAGDEGWYTASGGGRGTNWVGVGNLLKKHGLSVEEKSGADIASIRLALQEGKGVIVAVDAGVYRDCFSDIGMGHALWVTGLTSEEVIVNDSAEKDGAGKRVPIDKFRNALNEFENPMYLAWSPKTNDMEAMN